MKGWRVLIVGIFLLMALSGVLWRLFALSVWDRSFLLKQSHARTLRKINLPAYRGMITDRSGTALAISTPVDSVWANPQLFAATPRQLASLTSSLHLSSGNLLKLIKNHPHRQFVYLKRGNSPDVIEKIKRLNIPGVFFQREYRRYYPESEVTAHVIGATNIDDVGLEGLEYTYNEWLAGEPGQKEVLKDRLGHIISNIAVLKKPQQGHDLVLSLDHRLQYLAYRTLKETVEQYHAQAGSLVVLSVHTGEILSMVNFPSFNPNNKDQKHDERYRNRAVTDMFEPGSVIKPFTIAIALKSGRYHPESLIDTNPGWMRVGGFMISDHSNYGIIDLVELLKKSSTVAAAKILLSLGPKKYWQLLRNFGFGERTSSGFPGEVEGRLELRDRWRPSVIATLSYGYGMSVTTLQLAQAYAALAAGGVKYPVTFLKVDHQPHGKRVLSQKISQTIIGMLESVITDGTGKQAAVPGYRIAGKTGTAYIATAKGYDRHHYMSSFVGIAPASDPQLVVVVTIRDPQEEHFGAIVAAPAFSKVMSAALRLFKILPDKI